MSSPCLDRFSEARDTDLDPVDWDAVEQVRDRLADKDRDGEVDGDENYYTNC